MFAIFTILKQTNNVQLSYVEVIWASQKTKVLICDDFERPAAEPTFYVHRKLKTRCPKRLRLAAW